MLNISGKNNYYIIVLLLVNIFLTLIESLISQDLHRNQHISSDSVFDAIETILLITKRPAINIV
jgi:hypothetical protein